MTFRGSGGLRSEAFEQRLLASEPFQVIHLPGDPDRCRLVQQRWPKKVVTLQTAYGGIGRELRRLLGPDKIILVDSNGPQFGICGIGEALRAGEVSSSVLAEAQWHRSRISMTTPAKPAADVAFGVSEQAGRPEIKNIHLYEGGCERWARNFEHGKILLNMTRKPWPVDVGSGYRRLKGTQCPTVNNGAKVNGTIEVPAWDAVFLVRE